jgi:hypothetical protein
VFDELAAFRDRIFAKVGERPHARKEKVNWATFNCAECIEWQKRYDAAFQEEPDKNSRLSGLLLGPQKRRTRQTEKSLTPTFLTSFFLWQTE